MRKPCFHFIQACKKRFQSSMFISFERQINLGIICIAMNDAPCFLKIVPRGSKYKVKRMGARIEPWGTPQASLAGSEENDPI